MEVEIVIILPAEVELLMVKLQHLVPADRIQHSSGLLLLSLPQPWGVTSVPLGLETFRISHAMSYS